MPIIDQIDITESSAAEWIVLTMAIRMRQKEERDSSDLVQERAMLQKRIIELSMPIDRHQARVLNNNRIGFRSRRRFYGGTGDGGGP